MKRGPHVDVPDLDGGVRRRQATWRLVGEESR